MLGCIWLCMMKVDADVLLDVASVLKRMLLHTGTVIPSLGLDLDNQVKAISLFVMFLADTAIRTEPRDADHAQVNLRRDTPLRTSSVLP